MKLVQDASWRRVSSKGLPPPLVGVGAKIYQRNVEDGHLTVIVTREHGEWHVSISHRLFVLTAEGHPAPGRLPTWDEIKDARYRFMPDEITAAIILPPKADYVNVHPTTMHIFEIRQGK